MIKIKMMQTPVGKMVAGEKKKDGKSVLVMLGFPGTEDIKDYMKGEEWEEKDTPLLLETQKQLQEYFDKKRKIFELPIYMEGTPFQKKVWEALRTIPYGEIRTYKDIAEQIGNPKACRAVGGANHNNPIAIIVPCHRVIGTGGKLTGYAGGLKIKEKLLKIEKIKEQGRKY